MVHLRTLMLVLILGIGLCAAAPARAIFHLFSIAEVFSSADGTVQFVRLHSNEGSQNIIVGQTFTCMDADGTVLHSFTFPVNLTGNTANRDVLIGTANLASLTGGVAPDFVIPAGFIRTTNATVSFAGVSFVSYAQLPTDGQHSINIAGVQVINSVRNYSGATGSINVPPGQCCTGTSCTVTIQISCAGTWTVGAACGSGACGAAPTGVCCAAGGCAVLTQASCLGTWSQGGGCVPDPCVQPTGACCDGTVCSVVTAAACVGVFRGAGVACGTAGNPTTCCPANYDRSQGLTIGDIYVFLADWFAGVPRADFDGVDGINVRDIFAFLSAWFAGCS